MTQLRSTAPTFTRPSDTTQYGSGDLVANNTAAASVVALNFKFERHGLPHKQLSIRTGIISASGTGVTSKALRIHLFSGAGPTFTSAGDNSAISTVVATGAALWIGALDITSMTAVADGSFGVGAPLAGSEIIWDCTDAPSAGNHLNLYGILEARGAYTPSAQETFTVTIAGIPVAD